MKYLLSFIQIDDLDRELNSIFLRCSSSKMIEFYLALVVLAICLFFKYKLSFWHRRQVEGPAPFPLFGNLFDFVVTKKKHAAEIYQEIYKYFKKKFWSSSN